MKCRICSNKKGIAWDYAPPIIILLIVGALFIVLFNFNLQSKSGKIENDVQQQKDIVAGHDTLLGYLMETDEQGDNKADLILKSYYEKNYDSVKKDMEKYFKAKLSSIGTWRIEVSGSTRENLFSVQSSNNLPLQYAVQTAEIPLPLSYGQQYIRIKLFYIKP